MPENVTRTYCRNCGGWVAKNVGHRAAHPEYANARERADAEYAESLEPAKAGWRVTCATCWEAEQSGVSASNALKAVLGVDEPEEVAQRVCHSLVTWDGISQRFVGGISAMGNDRATGEAWGHIAHVTRSRLLSAYGRIVAAMLPQRCTAGACGLCGRATQVGVWFEGPACLSWSDGTRAPLCASCNDVWNLRGAPETIEDVRRVGVEAASGVPLSLGVSAPPELRVFGESRAADKDGLPEPWTFSEALTAYIESRWTAYPDAAPEDRREEFRERHAAMVREREESYRRARAESDARAW